MNQKNHLSENKPALRFPEFSGEWVSSRLADFTTWASGGTPSKEKAEYWDGDIPWISASSMRGTSYSDSDLKITPLGLNNGSKLAKKGSLLILVRGSMLFNKIPIGIATRDLSFNQDVKSIIVSEQSSSQFILYWFMYYEPELLSMVTGTGIGAGKLDLAGLKSLKLSVPSLPEQQKIASFLTSIDEKLQALKKKKFFLDKYKKGVMQRIFSQELRFKDDDGGNFPKWEEKTLGEVSEITMGQSPESSSYNTEGVGLYLIQGNADISNRKSNPRNYTSEPTKICEIGDIILTVRAPVGATAKSYHRACIGRGVCSIKNSTRSTIDFLYHYLLDYEPKWVRLEQGSTFTAISGSDIRSIEIAIPSLEEQIKIANFLSAIDEKISHTKSQIEKTEVWKKGLLQQMFC